MARRNQRSKSGGGDFGAREGERTLADAETDFLQAGEGTETTCPCGSSEFLLEAYLRVVDGRPDPKPIETEALTCPHCGREFDAVEAEDGRILRGDFLGFVDLDED